MKIAFFCPLGALSAESGLIFVLSRYLVSLGHELTELRCNGCFSVCDRDSENDWTRTIDQCIACESESKQLGAWAGNSVFEFSECVSAEEQKSLHYKYSHMHGRDLWDVKIPSAVEHSDVSISKIILPTFQARFSKEAPDFENRMQEQFVRKLALESLLCQRALLRFIDTIKPELFICSGAQYYLSQAARNICAVSKQRAVTFTWQLHERNIRISSNWSNEQLLCSLLLERVTSMRNDTKTWPFELLNVLREICQMMGIVQGIVVKQSQVSSGQGAR